MQSNKAIVDREDFLKLPNLPPRLKLWAEDYELEQFMTEKAFAVKPLLQSASHEEKLLKIAVVGSGPAGLGCADELIRMGYQVTVFERDDRAGGLLMYGVPNIKLPKEIIFAQLQKLESAGVVFKLQVIVGQDISLEELQKEYAAIVVCPGSTEPKRMSLVLDETKGIFYAKDYLTLITKEMFGENIDLLANAKGKDVVVIGGGDTGIDCAALAFAQGARSIKQLELRECEMTGKIQDGYCELATNDMTMEYSTLLKEILYDEKQQVQGVKIVKVQWDSGTSGNLPKYSEIIGSEQMLPAQLLLLATGFSGPEQAIFKNFGLAKTPVGTIAKGKGYFDTSQQGVFAAGDARRGQGIVEWAFAEGRNAAVECAQYLQKDCSSQS